MSASCVQGKALISAAAIDNGAVPHVEIVRLCLQDWCGAGEHVPAQRLARLPGGFTADPDRAGGPGPAPYGVLSVSPVITRTRLDRYAERGSGNLGDDGFRALTPCLVAPVWAIERRLAPLSLMVTAVLRGDYWHRQCHRTRPKD